MTRAQVVEFAVSRKLVELVNTGMDISEAFDTVFGEGAYKAFASSVYHQLRGE